MAIQIFISVMAAFTHVLHLLLVATTPHSSLAVCLHSLSACPQHLPLLAASHASHQLLTHPGMHLLSLPALVTTDHLET